MSMSQESTTQSALIAHFTTGVCQVGSAMFPLGEIAFFDSLINLVFYDTNNTSTTILSIDYSSFLSFKIVKTIRSFRMRLPTDAVLPWIMHNKFPAESSQMEYFTISIALDEEGFRQFLSETAPFLAATHARARSSSHITALPEPVPVDINEVRARHAAIEEARLKAAEEEAAAAAAAAAEETDEAKPEGEDADDGMLYYQDEEGNIYAVDPAMLAEHESAAAMEGQYETEPAGEGEEAVRAGDADAHGDTPLEAEHETAGFETAIDAEAEVTDEPNGASCRAADVPPSDVVTTHTKEHARGGTDEYRREACEEGKAGCESRSRRHSTVKDKRKSAVNEEAKCTEKRLSSADNCNKPSQANHHHSLIESQSLQSPSLATLSRSVVSRTTRTKSRSVNMASSNGGARPSTNNSSVAAIPGDHVPASGAPTADTEVDPAETEVSQALTEISPEGTQRYSAAEKKAKQTITNRPDEVLVESMADDEEAAAPLPLLPPQSTSAAAQQKQKKLTRSDRCKAVSETRDNGATRLEEIPAVATTSLGRSASANQTKPKDMPRQRSTTKHSSTKTFSVSETNKKKAAPKKSGAKGGRRRRNGDTSDDDDDDSDSDDTQCGKDSDADTSSEVAQKRPQKLDEPSSEDDDTTISAILKRSKIITMKMGSAGPTSLTANSSIPSSSVKGDDQRQKSCSVMTARLGATRKGRGRKGDVDDADGLVVGSCAERGDAANDGDEGDDDSALLLREGGGYSSNVTTLKESTFIQSSAAASACPVGLSEIVKPAKENEEVFDFEIDTIFGRDILAKHAIPSEASSSLIGRRGGAGRGRGGKSGQLGGNTGATKKGEVTSKTIVPAPQPPKKARVSVRDTSKAGTNPAAAISSTKFAGSTSTVTPLRPTGNVPSLASAPQHTASHDASEEKSNKRSVGRNSSFSRVAAEEVGTAAAASALVAPSTVVHPSTRFVSEAAKAGASSNRAATDLLSSLAPPSLHVPHNGGGSGRGGGRALAYDDDDEETYDNSRSDSNNTCSSDSDAALTHGGAALGHSRLCSTVGDGTADCGGGGAANDTTCATVRPNLLEKGKRRGSSSSVPVGNKFDDKAAYDSCGQSREKEQQQQKALSMVRGRSEVRLREAIANTTAAYSAGPTGGKVGRKPPQLCPSLPQLPSEDVGELTAILAQGLSGEDDALDDFLKKAQQLVKKKKVEKRARAQSQAPAEVCKAAQDLVEAYCDKNKAQRDDFFSSHRKRLGALAAHAEGLRVQKVRLVETVNEGLATVSEAIDVVIACISRVTDRLDQNQKVWDTVDGEDQSAVLGALQNRIEQQQEIMQQMLAM